MKWMRCFFQGKISNAAKDGNLISFVVPDVEVLGQLKKELEEMDRRRVE